MQSVSTVHSPIVWLSAGSYLLNVNTAIAKAMMITKAAIHIFINKRKQTKNKKIMLQKFFLLSAALRLEAELAEEALV